jgi:hypothetical protein
MLCRKELSVEVSTKKMANVAGLKDGVAVRYICGKLMQWMQGC